MKKFTWIVALLAVLVLVVTGCPGGGDKEEKKTETTEPVNMAEVFTGTKTTQDKAAVTVAADTATFSFTGEEMWGELVAAEETPWDVSGYTGIRFDYKSTEQATIFIQDPNSLFIVAYDGSDGWGAINSAENWTSLTIPFAILDRMDWFGEDAPFNKTVIKICFQISAGSVAALKKFEIRNLLLINDPNYKPPVTPPGGGENDGLIVIFDGSGGGFITGASIAAQDAEFDPSYVTATANNITVTWNDDEFRAKVSLTSTARADLTDYSKFGMAWTSGSATGGSFNISLYFSGNRMLNKTVSSGNATFDFVTDNPGWASGWGDSAVGTITGFEIYSDDDTSFGDDDLVITKIWFE
jgi:hypothetical protein